MCSRMDVWGAVPLVALHGTVVDLAQGGDEPVANVAAIQGG